LASEAVALLGPSGCGKTTTLRCIAGFERLSEGRIMLDGRRLARQPSRHGHLISAAEIRVPADVTVRETLAIAARWCWLDGAVDRELDACVARWRTAAWGTSGGERQRLAIAVCCCLMPVYVFDEPSANLASIASRMLIQRARS
jgi:putative spermidine/putrescine transport system ATP-binding protein